MKDQLFSPNERMLSNLDATWLACAIDTDGHISIQKRKNKVKGKLYDICLPEIGFTNNNYDISKKFGDFFQIKPCLCKYTWRVYTHNTKKIMETLTECLPYLIVKKEKAGLMIEYCKFRLRKQNVYGRYEKDLLFYDEMRSLNSISRRRRE